MNVGRTLSSFPAPRIALVGLGYWGPNLLRVLVDRADLDLRWICDTDAERLTQYGRRHPGLKLALELDEVLADPELDAVVLATPVFTHYELAERCLHACKHTFGE